MTPTRRDFLRVLLATPLAATFDVERLLWTPQTMITVPAMPVIVQPNISELMMLAWQRMAETGERCTGALLESIEREMLS